MALKATVCKASINISDTNRSYFDTVDLTIAQHPSETSLRLMARVLAYALHACDGLTFTKGLSTDSEPEIWHKSATGDILAWIDLGLPSPDRIKKASRQSSRVDIYTYQQKGVPQWLDECQKKLPMLDNLDCWALCPEAMKGIEAFHQKSMQLSIMIDGRDIWLSDDQTNLHIPLTKLCENGHFD